MRFLVTGHTGFKGAWLTVLLNKRGHEVHGISLDPVEHSLFESAGIRNILAKDIRCDIRDSSMLQSAFKKIDPDVVIHMAAQSLVRNSYQDPMGTFETNVNGTLNVLNATQTLKNVGAQLIVTTDKVYKNINKTQGYSESDCLGGHDPYSASKAMADIATQSWVSSFGGPPTAIARAGNVIGGGDIATDRLIPDLMNAFAAGATPKLRFPQAVRPWQFVLDCLNGYLLVIDSLLVGQGQGAWNFGPLSKDIRTVADVAEGVGELWGVNDKWKSDSKVNPHEAELLLLDTSKARVELCWNDKLNFEQSISWTTNWYKQVNQGMTPIEATTKDVNNFETLH